MKLTQNISLVFLSVFSCLLTAQEGISVLDGKVGIGTALPGNVFDVWDDGAIGRMRINNTGGVNAGLALATNSSNKFTLAAYQAVGAGNIDFGIYNDQTFGPSLLVNGSTDHVGIGTISPAFRLDVTDDSATGRIRINHTPASGIGPNAGFLLATDGVNRFSTAVYQANGSAELDFGIYNSQNQTASLIVDGTSNHVGIGTSSPEVRLEVNGGTSGFSAVLLDNARYYGVENSSGSNIRVAGVSLANDVFLGAVDDAGGKVNFREDGITAMTLHNRQLGIGTADPQRRLHAVAPVQAVAGRFESGNALGAIIRIHKSGSTEGAGAEIRGTDGYAHFLGPVGGVAAYGAGQEGLRITSDKNFGFNTTNFGNSGVGGLAIGVGTAPTSSAANAVQLFSQDVAATAELRVRDEAGNVTTLSPHNFSLINKPSHNMAWSYYSEKDGMAINVDMFRVVQLLEELTGEKLIHLEKISSDE